MLPNLPITSRTVCGSKGFTQTSDFTQIATGLIWRALGSPEALCRWRAAHCMRDFAAFGSWGVIDALVEKFSTTTAGPFQAAELKFYYMHARLWLLIALARLSLDYPDRIAKYKDDLLYIVSESKQPHVLMRHFAAQSLLACVNARTLNLPAKILTCVSNADDSPHPRLKKKVRPYDNFYSERPKGDSEPPFQFHLDYDFKNHTK